MPPPVATANNVIPFTKPRAISAHPTTFSQPQGPSPASHGSWGSQPQGPSPVAHGSWGSQPQPSPVAHGSWGSAATAAAVAPMPAPQLAVQPPPTPAQRPSATLLTPPRAPTNSNVSKQWSVFEQLGLGAPKIDHKKWSGHVVTAYRLLGFIILSVIVIVLIGYLVTTAFFYVSDSWAVPMALSPTDERVVSLQAQLSERQTNRDRIAAEFEQAERAIAVQQEFQAEFAKAIQSDLDGRKAALARMYELAAMAASTRARIKRSNSAYATASQKRMAQEWRAGLIDREGMLNGKFQIAQINSSNLSLAERQAEYETRAADLDSQTRALAALLDGSTSTNGKLSYDVLKIKQEFESSRLETQRAIDTRDMLKTALERENKLVDSLKKASYLKAMADGAQVAFVPYGNLGNAKPGAPLYGCALTMVFCKRVGTVLEVLPGEVQFKHPNRDKQMRGQMIEVRLDVDDAAAATDDVLFVGGKPMFI